jgi:tetratricopeptide (TPR) repeat protein
MAALPAQNESGLWQAWLLADDVVMVQALDVDYAPKGNLYTLPRAEFSFLLQALDGTTAAGSADRHGDEQQRHGGAFASGGSQNAPPPPDTAQASDLSPIPIPGAYAGAPPADATPHDFPSLQSATPEALDFTYTQNAAPALQDFTYTRNQASGYVPQPPSAPQSAAVPNDARSAYRAGDPALPQRNPTQRSAAGKRKLKADDPNLLLYWHEESVRASDAKAGIGLSRLSGIYNGAPTQDDASPGTESAVMQTLPYNSAQQRTRDPRLPDAGEIQARYAEQAMREEFTMLMESMPDDGQDLPLESAVAALIARDAPFFSRKQKFMFTEFGLALRRKNKSELALLAHLRALRLAPGDENVLFNVARTEYALGRPDNAVERLDAALQVNPGFTAAAHFLAFLRNADRRS